MRNAAGIIPAVVCLVALVLDYESDGHHTTDDGKGLLLRAKRHARYRTPGDLRRRLAGRLEQARLSNEAVRRRLNHYNKLQNDFTPSPDAVRIDKMPFEPSMYYYDLKEFARYFDPSLLIDLKFGDVKGVPKLPTLVKDRPISVDNGNAVVMKFNKFRHFHMPVDTVAFADKRPVVVWRGDLNKSDQDTVPGCRARLAVLRRRFAQAQCTG